MLDAARRRKGVVRNWIKAEKEEKLNTGDGNTE
jgi:hypothetical protein